MASNIPSILGVHVCSGAFSAGCDLDLFEGLKNQKDKPYRVSILFGHNGSGKSTIAREISAISKKEGNGYFYSGDKGKLDLEDEERGHIRVFDEDYVEAKIRIKANGLESIVMLGKQVEAADAIDAIDRSIKDVSANIESLESKIDKLTNGPDSVTNLETKAKRDVKGGGWKERRMDVTETNQNFTRTHWQRVMQSKTDQTRETLKQQFDSKLDAFKKAKDAEIGTITAIPSVETGPYDEARLTDLLSKQVDNPELSEREQRILELVKNSRQDIVETAETMFSSEETRICPMCQQEVTQEHKESIVKSIHKVLSKAVKKFKAELTMTYLPPLDEISNIPEQVTGSAKTSLQDAQRKVNTLIGEYNARIEKRVANVYTAQTEGMLGLDEALKELNDAVANVNKEIDSINSAIKNKIALKEKLLKINDQIAWVDARAHIEAYEKASADLDSANANLGDEQTKLQKLKSDEQNQEAALRQISIAIDVINSYLANVYFDSDRFKLVLDGERYKVLSHGHSVPPNEISTGERNVLALCYFFTEGGKDKERDHKDDDPQYIILDDPVSSFDMENRVGVCSLIRDRSEHVLRSNEESRITILTHDVSVVDDLQKIFTDISNYALQKSFVFNTCKLYEAATKKLSKSREYAVLLRKAYDFAKSTKEDTNESYVIGNVLRRIVEGYSTFNYGIGMEEFFREQELANRLGNHLPLLKSAMYRLVLNDESHMRERASTMNPSNNFERFSYKEKQKCAQCVLLMLYKFDQVHVKRQLKDISETDLRNQINTWERRFSSQEA